MKDRVTGLHVIKLLYSYSVVKAYAGGIAIDKKQRLAEYINAGSISALWR